jgi:hypothetical protein
MVQLLISGYGICWNIKWQSRDRAYQGRAIINKLIENERDRQERDGGKNFFQEVEITRSDWDVFKKSNDILSVSVCFLFLIYCQMFTDSNCFFYPGILFYY